MISILLEDKSIENFKQHFTALEQECNAIIILACDENGFDQKALDPILTASLVPVIGGIFPAIVYKNRQYNQGSILLGLKNAFDVTVIHNISQQRDYDSVIEEKVGILDNTINTVFLFFDGISQNIDTIIQSIFNNYGLSVNYVGGSAAGKDFQKKPILFSNEGLLEDALLFAATSAESTIGVKHGWEPVEERTYLVTHSKGNVIYEIDYQPAFEIFKQVIESHSGKTLKTEEFFEVARSYPLGINRLTGDNIVRVANRLSEDFALICTGDVLENSSIQILHANQTQLIDAAKNASTLSENKSYQKSFKLYIGCLARLLVLGENFSQEIEAIYAEDELLVGALSIGEIANNKDHYLELYNSTAVVAKVADV